MEIIKTATKRKAFSITYKFVIVAFLTFDSFFVCGQTKEETISYINNILELHSNKTSYYSFYESANNILVAQQKIYLNSGVSYLMYKFDPKAAFFVGSTTATNNVTDFVFTFKKDAVKLIYEKDGATIEEMSHIDFSTLLSMTKVEIEKLTKAYKHLIKLFGGNIKDDLF